MDGPNNGIVLYHYSFSPFARRVIWYLTLRGIDYAQCIQPPIMPRPDLEAIGVNYRRIPIMAIGRDVYCDSRLMLDKLEQLFPNGVLGASQPDQKAVQKLLEKWTIDAGVFTRASQLIPTSMPLLNDEKFKNDREEFSGRSWDKYQIAAMRPESLAHIREGFSFLERTLLVDNREWILKTEKPSLADIEAVWVFDWLSGLKDALPQDIISDKQYPKVFSWIKRFDGALKAARAVTPKPTTLKGEDAATRILDAKYAEEEAHIDGSDPTKLTKGATVEVWPIDTGTRHHDAGQLVSINEDEIVLRLLSRKRKQDIRLHFPRTNFRIRLLDGGEPKL